MFESTGRNFNVQPFISNLGMAKDVPVVDGSLAYDCPCTGEVCILFVMNALHVPSMECNLIAPFIMRSGSVIVNDVPKIHCEGPTVDNNCVSFDHSDMRITLQLNGVFSCFHTRVPNERELHVCEKAFITPDSSD